MRFFDYIYNGEFYIVLLRIGVESTRMTYNKGYNSVDIRIGWAVLH